MALDQTDSEKNSAQVQAAGHEPDVAAADQFSHVGGERVPSGEQTNGPDQKYVDKIRELRKSGELLRSDKDQPDLSIKPSWYDETQFENAKSVYARHFMGVNFAHLSGLLLLVRVNSIFRTLSSTGKSDSVAKLFRRYYQTVVHVKKWYEGDIFEENSEANRSLLIVRGMHNRVCSILNDSKPDPELVNNNDLEKSSTNVTKKEIEPAYDETSKPLISTPTTSPQDKEKDYAHHQRGGVHISEYDIMITQFAFVGFIVTRAKNVGLIDDFSQHDLESLLHFWRVIGYYLGAHDEYNLCSHKLEEIQGLCEAIMEVEYKRSIIENPLTSPPGIMGVNIVRSVKFIPMLTIYGITKYLYELLDLETAEFETRATRYSRLSYTLIKLVMSRLLAYRPFRWFNNGLTRLSVYLVGKIENYFANHLDSKYGQTLN